ncbi:Clp protease N-terminal domain-containing protein [Streptomyces sp. NPDC001985]|uniref:Clp protease N-terminal domain-containing protein n=1 Tax=Streptomyces sp. NPDC001985 TaxID=3154406 RepID=UPI003316E18F
MFERFTQDARDAVKGSVAVSERTGAGEVTEEHLLLAMLEQPGTRVSFAFSALGVLDRRSSLERALAEARGRAGLSRSDTEALAGLGIDIGEIVSRVERAHGPGALRPPKRARRWWNSPFTPEAKDVLTCSLRMATGRGDRRVGGEHLLLALTARPGVVAETLADHGATHEAVRRALYGEGGGER